LELLKLIISQGPMASIILTTTAFKQNKHHIAVNSRVLNGHSARFHGVFAPYADLRIMPTLRRQPLLQVAIAARVSA
jgi:hypothetical protein